MSRTTRQRAQRALAVLTVAAVAAGLLPVTLVAATSVAAAWHRGWQPVRLYRAAAWCLPMLAVWLTATAISAHHDADLDVLNASARQRSARRPATTNAPRAITQCDPSPRVVAPRARCRTG